MTLFPTRVVTSVEVGGQELQRRVAATWVRSGTTVTITRTNHGLTTGQAVYVAFTSGGGADGAYAVATVPDTDTFTVTTPAVGTAGDCMADRYAGGTTGFRASAAGQVAQRLGIDLVFPAGLYRVQPDGDLSTVAVGIVVETRQVDDAGAPLGGWAVVLDETVEARTATPLRRSYTVDLAVPGRYEVRARRTTEGTLSGLYDDVL